MSAHHAIEKLEHGVFDLIHFDYDLPGDRKGGDVVSYLAKQPSQSLVVVHSENPQGIEEIKHAFSNAMIVPFAMLSNKSNLSSRLKSLLSRPLPAPELDDLMGLFDKHLQIKF